MHVTVAPGSPKPPSDWDSVLMQTCISPRLLLLDLCKKISSITQGNKCLYSRTSLALSQCDRLSWSTPNFYFSVKSLYFGKQPPLIGNHISWETTLWPWILGGRRNERFDCITKKRVAKYSRLPLEHETFRYLEQNGPFYRCHAKLRFLVLFVKTKIHLHESFYRIKFS